MDFVDAFTLLAVPYAVFLTCVSWELIMCMEYFPVLRSEICVLRAWLGLLFQTASWHPSKIDSADFPRQLAGVPERFDVAFDFAVVFCVCQWVCPVGFQRWVSAFGFCCWAFGGRQRSCAAKICQELLRAARVARAIRFAIVIQIEELRV